MDVTSTKSRMLPMLRRLTLSVSICIATAMPVAAVNAQSTTSLPFTLLTSFPASSTGTPTMPAMSLVQGNDGNLYGLARTSGIANAGGMYSLTPQGALTNIYSFSAASGTTPEGPLIQASNGTFYTSLTNFSENNNTGGTVVGITSAGQLSTLHTFANYTSSGLFEINTDGSIPASGVVQAPNGTLYGTTYTGGSTGGGTLYSVTTAGAFTSLYTFPANGTTQATASGSNPSGALALGADGNLYGTTKYGGANGNGVVYQVTQAGAQSTLQSFPTSSSPGYCGATTPQSAETMTLGTDGKLYGTKCGGGANNTGYLYRFDPSTSTITDLYDFAANPNSNTGGSYPMGSLVVGPDGNLYGTAGEGGSNGTGTVFAASLNGSVSTVYNFASTTGMYPWPLTVGSDNNFYGTTLVGGAHSEGTAFQLQHLAQNDIVLTNNTSGVLDTRLINALGTQQIVQNVAQGYYPVAVGDFDGDGIPDILWTSANNDLYIWFGGKGSSTGFKPTYVGTYPAGWQVVGAGDIDGDGKADIYWNEPSTHQFGYWLMNGATVTTRVSTSYPAGWTPVALGDFDGDGKTDVLWSNTSNDLGIWFSRVTSTGGTFDREDVGTFAAGWKLVGTGDLNGDGKSDLVWMKTDGSAWGYWLMNGTQRESTVSLPLQGNDPSNVIVNVSDYNHDGLADLVWSNGSNLTLWTNTGSATGAITFSQTALAAPTSGTTVFNNNVH